MCVMSRPCGESRIKPGLVGSPLKSAELREARRLVLNAGPLAVPVAPFRKITSGSGPLGGAGAERTADVSAGERREQGHDRHDREDQELNHVAAQRPIVDAEMAHRSTIPHTRALSSADATKKPARRPALQDSPELSLRLRGRHGS